MLSASVRTATALKARIFSELSEAVATIGSYRLKPKADPYFANLFFHLFCAAKLNKRGALCVFASHAGMDFFFDQHFEMRLNFLVQVCFHTDQKKKDFGKNCGLSLEVAC